MDSSPKIERIEFLDVAKGLAILSIVLYHYLSPSATGLVSKVIMLGGNGIHLFLILSGFGLSLSSYSSSPVQFYQRRFVKILLPYYLFVTSLFVINQFIVFFPEGNLYAYLGHIFWYKMFDESIIGSFGVPLWFLSVIIQFYLIYPLLLYFKKRWGSQIFLTLSTLVSTLYWAAIIALGVIDQSVYANFFLQYLWEFCLGMVLAERYKRQRTGFWEQRGWTLVVVACVGIGVMGLMAVQGGTVGRELNDVPAALGYTALIAWLYLIAKQHTSVVGLFVYIGRISFELYLVHEFVASVLIRFLFHPANITLSFMASLVILPLAIVVAACYAKITQLLIQIIPCGQPALFIDGKT